jgi:hypothetical protein
VWPASNVTGDVSPVAPFAIVAVPFATVPGPNVKIFVPGTAVMSSYSAK